MISVWKRKIKNRMVPASIQLLMNFFMPGMRFFQQYGKKYHITSNLGIAEFKKRFGPRLVDRFKTFNVLPLCGESRRI